ncbi:VOC family protein [Aestuariispira insulae]|uniref:Catechol 2,3-dioxygenase-like lactoylglutathione lyase family enzyme n=1 Tax=Aestuariispira insulae TaxID=1461337 RepID=A0A3D9HN22_9PROT|nr:VOC family protein [Aestuariispira insulae]RED50893.1 catechol 2,3-dioxygenase-like lactoylglutathione lyase family enzyme [Aestuariispira insulae]
MAIKVTHLDHFVLTVADIDRTCDFYQSVFGMRREDFGEGRTCLVFGSQKINLHLVGKELEPKARAAGPGTGDICLITQASADEIGRHLSAFDVEIIDGPVLRTGAQGPITSYYFRDPDGNLLELSCYGDA